MKAVDNDLNELRPSDSLLIFVANGCAISMLSKSMLRRARGVCDQHLDRERSLY